MVVIVVIASVMVFTYATGLFGALLIPQRTATENISLEYASFSNINGNSNVTLYIRDTGSTPITLKSYYVRDGSGNQYARVDWTTGLNIAPGPFSPQAYPAAAKILISNACGTSCTVTGTAFTFTAGNVYTVTLVTAINSQFSLNIIR